MFNNDKTLNKLKNYFIKKDIIFKKIIEKEFNKNCLSFNFKKQWDKNNFIKKLKRILVKKLKNKEKIDFSFSQENDKILLKFKNYFELNLPTKELIRKNKDNLDNKDFYSFKSFNFFEKRELEINIIDLIDKLNFRELYDLFLENNIKIKKIMFSPYSNINKIVYKFRLDNDDYLICCKQNGEFLFADFGVDVLKFLEKGGIDCSFYYLNNSKNTKKRKNNLKDYVKNLKNNSLHKKLYDDLHFAYLISRHF